MNRHVTLVFVLLAFCTSVFGVGHAKRNYLITSNSVGELKIGMSVGDARKLCTNVELSVTDGFKRLTRYEARFAAVDVVEGDKLHMSLLVNRFDDDGNEIKVDDESKIVAIKVWSSQYRLESGLHAGMSISDAATKYGKVVEIFGFYGKDESVTFKKQPRGFEFLVSGKNNSPAGEYRDGRTDSTEHYKSDSYISAITVSGE